MFIMEGAKIMKDLLTIKEFSMFSGIEQTTLRYWDDIGLFSPATRNPENNYRYYSPEQIIAVNFIKVMSTLDFPLKTIGLIQAKRTPEWILELIDHQEKYLDMEMRRLRECYSVIHTRRELINNGIKYMHEPGIYVLKEEETPFILGPPNVYEDEDEPFYKTFMQFCSMSKELRINLNYPIGGWHENLETFSKAPAKPDRFFSADPTGNLTAPAGQYLSGFTRGFYGQLSDSFAEEMLEYARIHNIKTTGPVFTLYIHDEICINNHDNFLVKVCVAVAD
jgi:DNA-binding transcriptional MerR regulator/effector-binding domain-containing protein